MNTFELEEIIDKSIADYKSTKDRKEKKLQSEIYENAIAAYNKLAGKEIFKSDIKKQ